jgi:hypothetical protein
VAGAVAEERRPAGATLAKGRGGVPQGWRGGHSSPRPCCTPGPHTGVQLSGVEGGGRAGVAPCSAPAVSGPVPPLQHPRPLPAALQYRDPRPLRGLRVGLHARAPPPTTCWTSSRPLARARHGLLPHSHWYSAAVLVVPVHGVGAVWALELPARTLGHPLPVLSAHLAGEVLHRGAAPGLALTQPTTARSTTATSRGAATAHRAARPPARREPPWAVAVAPYYYLIHHHDSSMPAEVLQYLLPGQRRRPASPAVARVGGWRRGGGEGRGSAVTVVTAPPRPVPA